MSDTFKPYAIILDPAYGGLKASNYPNPYGLRAYKKEDSTYGGEMMPKGQGWQGVWKDKFGHFISEYSVGDSQGDFPSLYPGMTREDILRVIHAAENNLQVPEDIFIKAKQWADLRRSLGQSPFLDMVK